MAFPTGWSYKAKITQYKAKVAVSETGFPIGLIWTGSVSTSNLPQSMFDADGGKAAKSDGGDIRFTTDSAGTTEIPFEIVHFSINNDPASARAEIWVKRNISTAADTNLYIWWGNASASGYATSATYGRDNVWTNYLQVWHMYGEHPVDSTGGGIDAEDEGHVSDYAGGPFGTSKQFYGDADYGYYVLPNMGNTISQREFHALCYYPSSANVNGHIVSSRKIGVTSGAAAVHFKMNSDDASAPTINNIRAAIPSDATHENAANTATGTPDEWQLLGLRYNKASQLVYVARNGSLYPVGGKGTTNEFLDLNGIRIGQGRPTNGECNFTGYMDEVRITGLLAADTNRQNLYNSLIDPITFANIEQDILVFGDVQGRGEVSSSASTEITIAGDIQGRGQVSSSASTEITIAGDIQGRGQVESDISLEIFINGDIIGTGEVSGEVRINNETNAYGNIQGRGLVEADVSIEENGLFSEVISQMDCTNFERDHADFTESY